MTEQGHKRVTILGSTGSIGTQALDFLAAHPDRFRVVAIAAGGGNPKLLAEQADRFNVEAIAVHDEGAAAEVTAALRALGDADPSIHTGPHAATTLAGYPTDIVLNGITGSIGLAPTLAALKSGAAVALANKESLVAGGHLVRQAAKPGQLIPVDSEHSALAQALRAGHNREVRRLILTASGGPFRGRTATDLHGVTVDDALNHPTWNMGPVVTINSASLMNKALEVIEAYELFATSHHLSYDDIDVVIHPQSIVHSMVEFHDGSTIAQASQPDMRLPIGLALTWPDRLPTPPEWDDPYSLDLLTPQTWTFEPVDHEAFPAIALAKQAGRIGGLLPAIFNASNEECVAKFLTGEVAFHTIVATVAAVQRRAEAAWMTPPGSVNDVLAAERWAREATHQLLAAPAATPHRGLIGKGDA